MNPPALTSRDPRPQRGHGWPPLLWTARKSRTCVSNVGGTRSRSIDDRVAQRGALPRRVVDLLGGQARSLPERQEARGVQDLVAVGVADPGDERLVPQEVLELARVPL